MHTFLIIADDLTGAADTAARGRAAGFPATIAVTPPEPPLPTGVLAVNTDSRHLAPADAAARVQAICAPLVAAAAARSDVVWYKKIDSTLRGNLGAELDALMALCRAPVAVICPAFPAQARGLEDGFLVYAGATGARIHLPTLLRRQSAQSVALVSLAEVRRGPDALAARLRTQQDAGRTLLVVDALDETDLATLSAALGDACPAALLCGSAGLIGVLAARAAAALPAVATGDTALVPFQRMLIVVGSGSVMAHTQIQALATGSAGAQIVMVGRVDHRDVVARPSDEAPSGDAPVTLLHLPPPAPGAQLDGPAARALAAQLGDAAFDFVRTRAPDLLLLVGGDTAISLLTRLHVTRLEVVSELLPGMPLTRAALPDGTVLHVVLKAGNHGEVETLATLIARLLTCDGE
ncbi:MAG: four-carbon acid sugar kinase family protein [Caldilineaceae bacterium]|nr:four-carbon acid sugar kinase family protein [Caldilineaceae bacterium]